MQSIVYLSAASNILLQVHGWIKGTLEKKERKKKKKPTTNKIGKKKTDDPKSTILSEAQQRWEREA